LACGPRVRSRSPPSFAPAYVATRAARDREGGAGRDRVKFSGPPGWHKWCRHEARVDGPKKDGVSCSFGPCSRVYTCLMTSCVRRSTEPDRSPQNGRHGGDRKPSTHTQNTRGFCAAADGGRANKTAVTNQPTLRLSLSLSLPLHKPLQRVRGGELRSARSWRDQTPDWP
jgi:hypothetical protein